MYTISLFDHAELIDKNNKRMAQPVVAIDYQHPLNKANSYKAMLSLIIATFSCCLLIISSCKGTTQLRIWLVKRLCTEAPQPRSSDC